MHDLDRVSLQREGEFEGENFSFEGEGEGEGEGPAGGPTGLHETEATNLGADLLTVSSEYELEQLLGHVIDRVAPAIDRPTGQAVIEALKPVAKAVIPGATNGAPPGKAAGTDSSHVERSLGLELEGMSNEDRELEAAKQVMRIAAATVANAASAPPDVPPHVVAQTALRDAAQHLAPALLAAPGGPVAGQGAVALKRASGAQSGRWFRRGNEIVLVGV